MRHILQIFSFVLAIAWSDICNSQMPSTQYDQQHDFAYSDVDIQNDSKQIANSANYPFSKVSFISSSIHRLELLDIYEPFQTNVKQHSAVNPNTGLLYNSLIEAESSDESDQGKLLLPQLNNYTDTNDLILYENRDEIFIGDTENYTLIEEKENI